MSLYRTDQARPLGAGHKLPGGSLTDPELAQMLASYKRSVASRYKALTHEEIDQLPTGRLLVSPKVDGECWFLIFDGEDVFLANPKGRCLVGDLPILNEAAGFASRVRGRTVFAGELMALRKGGRARSGDLARAISGESGEEMKRVAFVAFDLVQGGNDLHRAPTETYEHSLEVMRSTFEGGKRAQAIRTEALTSHDAISERYQEWVASGRFEGLVCRDIAAQRTFKVKPVLTFDAVVVGYIERGEDPTQLRSVLLAMMRDDGQFQVVGRLGNFPGDEVRRELLPKVKGTECPSNYREASNSGAVYRFVRPEVVMEVKAVDVQAERSDGDVIERMVMDFDPEKGWRAARRKPSVSILAPVFVRVRHDKSVNTTDVRIAQLLERVSVPEVHEQVDALDLPPSEIVTRRVWTKETKGQVAVRKLLVFKTNKHETDASWPDWVVHWTDYSPGRKAPITRKVHLAPDEAAAQALADDLVTAGVKRGWNEV